MSNKNTINIFNLVGFIFLLYASFLFRKNGNMISPKDVQVFFMPAPYAFSIWIIIYISLFIWIIKGFLASPKDAIIYKDVGLWFFVCTVLTGISVLVNLKISPIFIIGALVTSLVIYTIINNSQSKIYRLPFSLLCPWLSVATIVNISLWLKSMGFSSLLFLSETTLTIFILIIATLIAILFTLINNDILFALVFIWAYIGIIIQNSLSPIILRSTFIMVIILLVSIIYNIYTHNVSKVNEC